MMSSVDVSGTLEEEIGSVYMDAKKKLDTGSRDAISSLPEEVLGYILSFVPTKLAASTSLLSKKWSNVFALVHNLELDDSDLLEPEKIKLERDVTRESFRNFVDRTLAVQCASPIKKFSLRCEIDENKEMAYVSGWVLNAIERGVLELEVIINLYFDPLVPCSFRLLNKKIHNVIDMPCALFTSKTLVKLRLGTRIHFEEVPPDVSLPALKSLSIDSILFHYNDLCYVLLPGCPVLEEVFIRHKEYQGILDCISISNKTIKKLSVDYDSEFEFGSMNSMSFDAPSLVSLDYSDYIVWEYPLVKLGSLVEARRDLHYSSKVERPDISGLIVGISKVETLHLSPASVDVISGCVKDGLVVPVLDNMVSLTFGSNSERGWKLLPHLIKQSPKLETVIIQGLDGTYIFQGKVLHVLGSGGTARELEYLKNFLGETEVV